MALASIRTVQGRAVYVPGDDIDTDRIIPARFMKCVTFDGLGGYLFYDVRHEADGKRKNHPLNDPKFSGASVLVSGRNFGCGSSREHAPQALAKFGIRAVIAESFAEIFFGNATTLGMPCVALSRDAIQELAARIEGDPSATVTIDLERGSVSAGAGASFPASIKAAAREALMDGLWDPIAQLLEGTQRVREVASKIPYVSFRTESPA